MVVILGSGCDIAPCVAWVGAGSGRSGFLRVVGGQGAMGSGRCGGQAPQPLMGSDHEGGPFVGFFHVQTNLAGVMCDHGRGVEQAEPKAFRFPEATCVLVKSEEAEPGQKVTGQSNDGEPDLVLREGLEREVA